LSRKRRLGTARLFKHGKKFEVIVNIDKAWKLKSGEKIDIKEVVEGEFIYYDVRQGLKASSSELRRVFGTDDVYEVAKRIILEGEIQLTAEQRRELIEAKRRQIIEFLSKHAVDARTGLPIPPTRIELAMKEAGIGVDPLKPVEDQINDVIKALRPYLPLKIAKALVAVRIPSQFSGRAYGELAKMGKVIRVNYLTDGSLSMELEIPAGMQEALVNKVISLTKGQGEVRVIRRE